MQTIQESEFNTVGFQSVVQQETKMEQPAQANLTQELMAGRTSDELANIDDPEDDIAALKDDKENIETMA